MRTFLLLSCALLAGLLGSAQLSPSRDIPRGKLVHSFPPTPIYRGVAGGQGQAARAELIFNNRSWGLNASQQLARVELSFDLIAQRANSGEKLGDYCTQRTFDMETPLDLKSIRFEVTQTGVQIRWPDGSQEDVVLFSPGENVEVSFLAMALRGDGFKQSSIERASLRVQGDLDGDGVLEFDLFQGADHQGGFGTTS